MESLFLQNTFWKAMVSGLRVVVGGAVEAELPGPTVVAAAELPAALPELTVEGGTAVEVHCPVCAAVRPSYIQTACTNLQLSREGSAALLSLSL